ncbi:solute carrier family 22 member 6-B-like [Centroberyx gerrardi]
MKFDSILSEINGFGKFQIMLLLIQTMSRITLPCHFLLNNFIAAVPSHHCDLSTLGEGAEFRNLTLQQRLAVSVPVEKDGTPSSCQMFAEPQYQYLSVSNSSDDTLTVQCQNGWVYDNSTFRSTLATEWDLVCSRKGMNKATATIFFIGVMFGAPLFGFLSDRFGRRKLLLVSYLSTIVFSVISAFSTSYVMFVIMRFFTGMTLSALSIISICLNVEWFGIEHRTFSGIIISLDWTLGNWILVGFAYFVNEWRMLILAVTSPLIFSIIAWWWLPESARWLLANGKADAAHLYLTKCAKMNNRSKCMDAITPEVDTRIQFIEGDAGDKKYTFLDLVRTPKIRKLVICSGIVWYGVAFTYYGISLNITGFGLNPYLTQFVFASIEMPIKIGVYYFLKKIGRRPGQVWALLLTGLCLFINLFVPTDKLVARTVVAVLGKALSEASFTIVYLFTIELYPTVVRQNGLGYTSFMARLGVSIAPLIMLLDDVWHLLPALIYCTVATGSGLVASLLPETLDTRLPEFIEDIEQPSFKMKFENVLAGVDGFGRFQAWIILLLVISRITLPFHFLLNNFIAVVPSHHCNLSTLDDGGVFRNLTLQQRLAVGIPRLEDGTPSSCQMFAEPQYHLLLNSSNITDLPMVPCQNGWVYDNTTFKSTLATEWDLVCDKRRVNMATATIFFMGVMLGAAVFGSLSDRYGRKRMLLVSYLSAIFFGFASAFSYSFTMFAVMRFLTGFSITGISIISIVLCVEWVDMTHRTAVGVLMSMDLSIFTALLPFVAYFVNDWRYLTATLTTPLFLAVISWWWLPESARWLISNGKVNDAHFYLSRCAKFNHREQFMADLKPETLSKVILVEKENRTYSYLDLVRTPRMRRLTLLTGTVWCGVACIYYGISLNITGFGVNIYLTQFIHGAIEIPAKVFIYYSLNKIGRRLNQVGTLVLTGVCIFSNIFIPQDMWLFRTVVGILGKGFSTATLTILTLYTTELYPTVVRQNGLGYSFSMGRVGVSAAPLIILLDEVWVPLPSVVFCLVAFTTGLLAYFLPETHNVRLPETIEDIEQTRRRSICTSDE